MTWMMLAAICVSFVLSLLLTPVSQWAARRFGVLDYPQRHKAHARPTPLLGGSAVFTAILLPTLGCLAVASEWARLGVPGWVPQELATQIVGASGHAMRVLGLLVGALVLHVMGIIDDRRPLGPWVKLVVQIAVALWATLACGLEVLTVAGPVVSVVLTVIWIVAITNSVNFLDNMDGLATGVSAICIAALIGATAHLQQVFLMGWLCVILGSLLGFLPTNFPPARQFLGDAGSLVVGYLLAVVSTLATYVGPGETYYAYGIFVPLVLLAVPIYDTASVMTIRIREGRNPMIGDRRHFSHRLVARGMSVRTAVLTIYLCTAATAVGAVLLPRVQDSFAAALVFLQTAAIVMVIALLESSASTRKP